MTAPTLTDRYVWTVTRHLPAETGPDVAQELRATIGDAVDDKVGAGTDPTTAEREALIEMGDPDVLSREYGGRPTYLIGPDVYPSWVRLMRVLFPIVLPLVLVANFLARAATDDEPWGRLLLEAFLLTLTVAVHLAFWTTATFAVIEWTRPESARGRPLTEWAPEHLTAEVPGDGIGRWETAFEVTVALALAALVAWQVAGVGETGVQVLDPGMGVIWKVVLVGFFLLDAALATAAWRLRRWTPALAAVNVACNAAAIIVLLWLLSEQRLLTDLPQVLGDELGWSTDWSVPTGVVAAIIVLTAGWDAVATVAKARRGARVTQSRS